MHFNLYIHDWQYFTVNDVSVSSFNLKDSEMVTLYYLPILRILHDMIILRIGISVLHNIMPKQFNAQTNKLLKIYLRKCLLQRWVVVVMIQ